MKSSTWNKTVIFSTLTILAVFAAITIYVDPFFQYHTPNDKLNYVLEYERYQNPGIAKNFSYDAVIAGSSMCENFKTSEFDSLFDVNSVKLPYAGGSYKQIDTIIRLALNTHPDVKYVVRCLDYSAILLDKDNVFTLGGEYPEYLYDSNLFNDVKYLLNKDVLFHNVLPAFISSSTNLSFDEYCYWSDDYEYGGEELLLDYQMAPPARETATNPSDAECEIIMNNLNQNVCDTVAAYPDTTFYFFFPPYSILTWDLYYRQGQINHYLMAEDIAIRKLLEYDNARIFSFNTNMELITSLDNYKDKAHFGGWVNSWILQQIKQGNYEITKDNCDDYLNYVYEFFNIYYYDGLYN